MDQQKRQYFSKYNKIPLKFNNSNAYLPFVTFLNNKNIEFIQNNSHLSSTRKVLRLKRKKVDKTIIYHQNNQLSTNCHFLRVPSIKKSSPSQRPFQEFKKEQQGKMENSSKHTYSSQMGKTRDAIESEEHANVASVSKLLRSCIYLNYDIINASRAYNQQKQNIITKKYSQDAKQHPSTKTMAQARTNSRKNMKNVTHGSSLTHRQPKLKRINTDFINLSQVFSTTSKFS